ncbi:MAG: hypothetical protein H6861_01885 [Rhodospirillales bacterium]|nr:hypothetical protein [Rhodospirillales bacterium]
MPKEDRRIIFTHDEVYKALYALCVQKQLSKPPAGAVKAVKEKDADGAQIVLDLENPAQEATETVEYARDFLAAALMVFCRGAGIPLPKSAQKSVLIHNGEVILRVQI